MRTILILIALLILNVGNAQTWEFSKIMVYKVDTSDCHLVKDEHYPNDVYHYKNKVVLKDSIFSFNNKSKSKVLRVERRKDGVYYYCRNLDRVGDYIPWEGYIVVKKNSITVLNWGFVNLGDPEESVYICYN